MREKYFPSSWNTGAERFCSLFHRYGYIYRPILDGSWLSADEKWQLTDTEILKAIACAHPKFFIGARAGKASKFAVLDIDTNSEYHCLREVERIREVLFAAGINKTVPYQSSSSGGWHLYIFFDQPVSSRDLNKQLTLLLQLNDFNVQKGQLEIFPNPGSGDSIGCGLRLPMQPGWAWLHPTTMELVTQREDICAVEALALFLFDLDNSSNSYHDFHQLKRNVEDTLTRREKILRKASSGSPNSMNKVVSIRSNPASASAEAKETVLRAFGDLPPGILADVWVKGRDYYQNGLSGPSQRADAIYSLSHYLFYGNPESELPALGYGREQERQWLLEEILSSKHNGHSEDLNHGRADALAQIRRAAHWRPDARKDEDHTQYSPEVPISWILENKRRQKDARARIKQAVLELQDNGNQFTLRDIQAKAKCSFTTLSKHKDLLTTASAATEPDDYEQIAEDLFDTATHEYNAVVGLLPALPSEPSVSSSVPNPSVGLLACCLIAYELSVRANRAEADREEMFEGNFWISDRIWRMKAGEYIACDIAFLDISALKSPLGLLIGIRRTSCNSVSRSRKQFPISPLLRERPIRVFQSLHYSQCDNLYKSTE